MGSYQEACRHPLHLQHTGTGITMVPTSERRKKRRLLEYFQHALLSNWRHRIALGATCLALVLVTCQHHTLAWWRASSVNWGHLQCDGSFASHFSAELPSPASCKAGRSCVRLSRTQMLSSALFHAKFLLIAQQPGLNGVGSDWVDPAILSHELFLTQAAVHYQACRET